MAISSIGAPADQALGSGPVKSSKSSEVGTQFESLLIAQMLKSIRESGGGWLGTGEEDSAGDTAMGMAEEQFAAAISSAGGFGLAKLVNSELKTPNLSGSVHFGANKPGGGS